MKDKFKRLKKGVSNRNNRIPLILSVFGIIIVAAAAVFVIRAYLSATTQVKENPFGPMTYTDFDLGEAFDPNIVWEQENEQDVDIKISKDPYITVDLDREKKPVYVRFSIVTAVYASGAEDAVNITALYPDVKATWTLTDDWTQINSSDGTPFYYYNRIVLPVYESGDSSDGKTLPMFESVNGKTITVQNAKTIPKNAQVRITVIADCVQAVSIDNASWRDYSGNFSAAEVAIAWGKTPTGPNGGALPSVQSTGEYLTIEWPTT